MKTEELLTEVQRAFSEFKTSNDQRLKEIESRGEASAETIAKVNAANADISRLQDEIATVRAALRVVENDNARIQPENSADVRADRDRARSLFARAQNKRMTNVRTISDEQLATTRAYADAESDFLWRGAMGMSEASRTTMLNSMQTNSDPQGGYLTSPDRTGRMVQLIYETTPMRELATVETTTKDRIEGELDLDEVDGGLVGEVEDRDETNTPTVGRYAIILGEFFAQPRVSQRTLDTADIDLEPWLDGKVSDKIARLQNKEFTLGKGLKGPRGFLTYAVGTNTKSSYGKIQQIKTGADGAFATRAGEVNGGDVFIKAVTSMKSGLLDASCRWLMSRLTLAQVRMLKDGQANYLWQPDFAKYEGGSIQNYGITLGEDMPQIANDSLSIAFGNWKKGYTIYDHAKGFRTLRDNLTKKGWVKFYTTVLCGGDVVDFDAIKIIQFKA